MKDNAVKDNIMSLEDRLYAKPSNLDAPESRLMGAKVSASTKQELTMTSNPQTKSEPFRLTATPVILLVGIAVVLGIIVLRPQSSGALSANSAMPNQPVFSGETNPKARIIINGVDQTEAVQLSPRFSLSWLEPADIRIADIDRLVEKNGKDVLIFRDGSERVLSSDVMYRLSDHVKNKLFYGRTD